MSKQAKQPKAPKAKENRTSFHRMVPNMMTIGALCAGMSSMQFAIAERWEASVLSIVIAAFLDACDGAVARMLKATSKLGAELDTLSDFLCFGVAPAMVLHLWALHEAGRWGWIIALAFAIAMALRLARFNAMSKEDPKSSNGYFTGVPAPTAAGMAILPMIISFQIDPATAEQIAQNTVGPWTWLDTLRCPEVVGPWMLLFSGLMVSNLPTLSTKQISLPPKFVIPALAAFGLFVAGLINAPWPTLTLMGIVYGAMLPVTSYLACREKKKNDA